MRFFYFILLIGFCLTNNSIAQMSVVWENSTIALDPGKGVLAQEYVIDSEGNTIVAGFSQYDFYTSERTVFVMKIDPDGTELWKQTLTPYLTEDLYGFNRLMGSTVNGLFVDENDNIILFAKFLSLFQGVIKYDKEGNFISFDAYDFGLPKMSDFGFPSGDGNRDDLFDKVHQDNGGNFLIGGLINFREIAYSYHAEFNPQGALIDSRYDLRGDSLYQMSHITLLHPGNDKTMFLFANCGDGTNPGILISKLTAQGALEWTNVNWISNQDIHHLNYHDVLMDNSGNFYLAISYRLNSPLYSGSLIKFDPAGVLLWEVPLGVREYFSDIEFDSGGNIWASIDHGGVGSTILKKFSGAAQLLATVNSNSTASYVTAFRTKVNYNNDVYVFERRDLEFYISKYDWSGTKIEELKLPVGIVHNIGFFDILANNDIIVGYSDLGHTYIVKVTDGATSVDEETTPIQFQLSQNYPNPFNPSTTISYSIPEASNVKLVVIDALGREIKTLVNQAQNAGSYSIDFNAERLSSGIYFYRLSTGQFSETKKLLLLR